MSIKDIVLNKEKAENNSSANSNLGEAPRVRDTLGPSLKNIPNSMSNTRLEGALQPGEYDFDAALKPGEGRDWINNMLNSWDKVQQSNYEYDKYKKEVSLDDNVERRKTLDYLHKHQAIDDDTYFTRLGELEVEDDDSRKGLASAQEGIDTNEQEIKNNPVSDLYRMKETLANSKGTDKSWAEALEYTLPSGLGSMGSLAAQQMVATFGREGLKRIALSAMAAGAEGSVLGPHSGLIAATAATVAQIGLSLSARYSETKSELGDAITTARQKLTEEWIKNNPEWVANNPDMNIENIPEEALVQIRKKAMNGTNEMFWQEMSLAIPDIMGATLASSLFKGSSIIKGLGNVGEATRGARIVKAGLIGYGGTISEKFEEGYQKTAADRHLRSALNLNQAQDKNFMSNFITDAIDTVESINLSLPYTGNVNLGGKYANDVEFQEAAESGGLLGFLGGAATSSTKIVSDLITYHNTAKELGDKGIIDLNKKVFKLKDTVYLNHFEKDTVEYLLEGIRNLTETKDDKGNFIMTKEQAATEVKNVTEAYDKYKKINRYIDNILPDKSLGFRSAEQKEMLQFYKANLFHNSLSNVRNADEVNELSDTLNSLNTETKDFTSKEYSLLLNKIATQKQNIAAITKLKNDDLDVSIIYGLDRRLNVANEQLTSYEKEKEVLEKKAKEINIPLELKKLSLEEINANVDLVIAHLNRLDIQKDEVLDVKDNASLKKWFEKYKKVQSNKKGALNNTTEKKQKEADLEKERLEQEALRKKNKEESDILAKQQAEEERRRKEEEMAAKKAAEEMQKKGSVEAAIFVKSDGSQQNIKRGQRFSVENDEFIIDDIQVDNGQITRVDLADNNGDEWSVDNQEQLSLMFDKAVFESTVPTEEQANIELVTNLKKAFEETDEDVSLEVNEDPSVNKPKLSELDKIERKRKALIDIIKAAGLPKTKFSFPEFWKKLLELPFEAINLNKQEFLTKNFLGIKDIINSIQRSNGNRDVAATTDEYLLNEDLTVYLPGSNEESPLPQGTPKEIYDLNTKINKGLIEKNIISGYKLTNGLSIARRDVDLELIGDEDGAVYKDAKKDGFFPNTILNFLNTELTPVGTKLIFRTASKYNDKYFDKNNKEQSYLDEWPIDIFVTIAGKEERVGTLHTPQYVNINNMAESLTEEELIDQANNLRAIRNEILNNSENDFESVITVKKDGFLNRNDYVHQKSLAKAFGTDKRIVLGVKVNSELFTSKEVENVQSNDFLVNGSTFIMVPDAKGVYVTRYVNKKQLKNNEVILNKLVSAFDKLMTTGIRDTNISKYLYTSNRNTLGLEGVMINSNNEVFINGTKFTEVNEDFKKALGNIYINISKDLIQNKAYLNEMFESGLLTTDIQQVKSEVNGKEVYSYFSQTTTEFANPAIAKTSKNTESTQKNDTSIIDNTEKSSNLTAEEIKNSIKNNFEQDFDEDINVEFNIKPSLEEENTIKEQKKNCK